MTSYLPHRCRWTIGKPYLAYLSNELPSDIDPFLLRQDGFTTILEGSRFTLKELKDGRFIILRDMVKEDYQFRQKESEGHSYQAAAFDYNSISHHYDQQYVDEETHE